MKRMKQIFRKAMCTYNRKRLPCNLSDSNSISIINQNAISSVIIRIIIIFTTTNNTENKKQAYRKIMKLDPMQGLEEEDILKAAKVTHSPKNIGKKKGEKE